MYNLVADYTDIYGADRHAVFQVCGAHDAKVAAHLVANQLLRQGYIPRLITRIYGTYTMKELEHIVNTSMEVAFETVYMAV